MFFLKPITTCCCSCFLVIILLVCGGAVLIAKTGLVTIPWVSSWVYSQPTPSQPVGVDATTSQQTEQAVAEWALTAGQTNTSTPLLLSESGLTQVIRQTITSSQAIDPETLQVATVDGSLELFARIRAPLDAFVTLQLQPVLSEAGIELSVEKVKIGQLELPVSLFKKILEDFIHDTLAKTYEQLGTMVTVESLTVTPEGVRVMAMPNTEQPR